MYATRSLAAISIFIIGCTAVAGTTRAQQDWNECSGSGVEPDQAIKSCTEFLRSASTTDKSLAIAFTNRGRAYLKKGDYDHAITDFSEAIRLDAEFGLDSYLEDH